MSAAEQGKPQKILIIKLGYSETLIPAVRQACSLGDVFRSTVLLHLFKNDHVTWLTDQAAIPLLEGNPYIQRILPFEPLSVMQIEEERFDRMINLEKIPGVCAMVGRIDAWAHYGFRFDKETGEAQAFERAHDALAMATREDFKKLQGKCWAEMLYSMLGKAWTGESYVLGYKPTTQVQHDLGFNIHVGELLPLKAWPSSHWDELAELVEGEYTFSYQQHLEDLHGYMDWINSCRMLITNDSLGLYLGIALGKKVLGLFGPTPASDQSPHENLRIITPQLDLDCMPCLESTCARGDPCMKHLSPSEVFAAIREWGL
jgi:heptosyltransferase-2